MIPAFEWDRLHPDYEAAGQRWYCKACRGTKYKCKFGQVVELRAKKQGGNFVIDYFWTSFTPQSINDAQLMTIQDRFATSINTVKELMQQLPMGAAQQWPGRGKKP